MTRSNLNACKVSFRDFIFRQHGIWLFTAVGVLIIHFIVIKTFFPHAFIVEDSHHYIDTARNNLEITAWPIGYSKLLEWLHFLTKSDWIVVFFQFILLETSILYFYFSVLFLFQPGKWISIVILFFLIMNPFVLCISNYIMTDAIFAALTVIWFTLTLWHLYIPRVIHLYLLILLICLMFTIRFYAIFYPLITIPVIIFTRTSWKIKLSSIALGILLIVGFVQYTENLFLKKMGQRLFSPFSGWQLAGNALIMYRHVSNRENDTPPDSLRPLHQQVLHDLNNMPSENTIPDDFLHFYFTWNPASPLMKYSHVSFPDNVTFENEIKWASVAKLYHDYGVYLITKHPFAFIHYYIGQNIDWFIKPRVEYSNVYPSGQYYVFNNARDWFGYRSNWISCSTTKIYSISYYPLFLTLINLILIVGIVGFFYCGCYKDNSLAKKAVIFIGIYWLANFLFIITIAPVLIRYDLSTMIIGISFAPILLEQIYFSK